MKTDTNDTMEQITKIQNSKPIYSFKGSNSERHDYNRMEYKKWPWVSLLVAALCCGTIFFVTSSPRELKQMKGATLVLCCVLVSLGSILLFPSALMLLYLLIYYILQSFKCPGYQVFGRPFHWAMEKNTGTKDDPLFTKTQSLDENDNKTVKAKNRRKQEQDSAARRVQPGLEELSVPGIMYQANSRSIDTTPAEHGFHRSNAARSSVYSVQADRSLYADTQGKTQYAAHNYPSGNHSSMQRERFVNQGYEDSEADITDNESVSIHITDDDPYDITQRSQYSDTDSRRSLYGVSRAPNLGVGIDPPSTKPPVEAHVIITQRPTPERTSRPRSKQTPKFDKEAQNPAFSDMQGRPTRRDTQGNTSRPHSGDKLTPAHAYRSPKPSFKKPQDYGRPSSGRQSSGRPSSGKPSSGRGKKTLAQYAAEAPSRATPVEVSGYQKTSGLAGYHESQMYETRPSSKYHNHGFQN